LRFIFFLSLGLPSLYILLVLPFVSTVTKFSSFYSLNPFVAATCCVLRPSSIHVLVHAFHDLGLGRSHENDVCPTGTRGNHATSRLLPTPAILVDVEDEVQDKGAVDVDPASLVVGTDAEDEDKNEDDEDKGGINVNPFYCFCTLLAPADPAGCELSRARAVFTYASSFIRQNHAFERSPPDDDE